MPSTDDQIVQLLRQMAEQQAVMIRELRTLSTKVEGVGALRPKPPPGPPEPTVRPYDAVHTCSCSSGWVFDDEAGEAKRCLKCHPAQAGRSSPPPPPEPPEPAMPLADVKAATTKARALIDQAERAAYARRRERVIGPPVPPPPPSEPLRAVVVHPPAPERL